MKLEIKRVYTEPAKEDGQRILVDRLWPRGISKEKAQIDLWLKDIAPSNELRKWFAHEPSKWKEFKEKYFKELKSNPDVVKTLSEQLNKNKVTLVFSAKEERFNNAVALKEFIETYISPER